MDLAAILTAIRSLSIEEKLQLLQAIKEDIVEAVKEKIVTDQQASYLTEAQKSELERRLADDEANPDDVIPWEVIKAEARARTAR